jgi:hypothetical protein
MSDLGVPSSGRSATVIAWASGLWLVGVVILDIAIHTRRVVLIIFLPVAPLAASAALGAVATGAFAAAACGIAAASHLWDPGGTQYWIRLTAVALLGALSVFTAAVRSRREQALRASQRIATAAQEALLPILPARINSVLLATRYHSATRSAQVGGDFFDFVADGKRTRLILGDISGKGIEAVTQAARVIRAFRQYGAAAPDLLTVARRVHEYVLPFWQGETYATAVLVELDEAATFTVVSCGHPPPLFISGDSVTDLPTRACLPLGIGGADASTKHHWSIGDELLLYTDGLIEARNPAGQFLPRRLIDEALASREMEESLDCLLAAVEQHAGRFSDDLALLLMRRQPHEDRHSQDPGWPIVTWPRRPSDPEPIPH